MQVPVHFATHLCKGWLLTFFNRRSKGSRALQLVVRASSKDLDLKPSAVDGLTVNMVIQELGVKELKAVRKACSSVSGAPHSPLLGGNS